MNNNTTHNSALSFARHSGVYSLYAEQWLPAPTETIWEFISQPKNLSVITPPHMKFVITNPQTDDKMYAGQIITYRVHPIKGFKTNWVTEIKYVADGHYFVDEQLFGPYKLWHHKHFIVAQNNGTLMTDIVHFKIPFGFLGHIAYKLLIKRQLTDIFRFRESKLNALFG